MTVLFGLLLFIATVLISMVMHEAGHFLIAKRFGVIADEFSIGLGKKAVFSVTKGKTKWSLRPVPLGAYCDFVDREGGLCDLPVGKRIAVYLAGPLTNILSGMVLFIIAGALVGKNIFIMMGSYFALGFQTVGDGIMMIGKVFSFDTYADIGSGNGMFSSILNQFSGIQAVSGVLMMAAILMFILGLSNLLPIPGFDGGQILFALPELFGKKLKLKTVNKINYVCFMAITVLSLMILAEVGLGLLYGSL